MFLLVLDDIRAEIFCHFLLVYFLNIFVNICDHVELLYLDEFYVLKFIWFFEQSRWFKYDMIEQKSMYKEKTVS